MSEIKTWQKRIDEISALIAPLASEQAELRRKILLSKSKFKIGDIIVWKGKKGRVFEVKEWCCGDPMWKVVRIKNDGSDGAPCEVREYENPILAP